jgi:integrase
MHKALTQIAVERMKPPAKGQLEVFDRGYAGLSLRVSYGGQKSWTYLYRVNGKLRRMTLGSYPAVSLADARKAWRKAREDVAAGRDPLGARSSKDDFATVAREWLARDQAKNRSIGTVTRAVERELIPVWGSRQINSISRRDVRALVEDIHKRAPVMALRVQAYIHRLFRWAVNADIVEHNPAGGLFKPHVEQARERVLTHAELAALWDASSDDWPFGDAMRLLILTGARREEIRSLRWSEIHGDKIVLEGARTKNGKAHAIPLSPPAQQILACVPRVVGSDYVFTKNGQSPFHGWSHWKAKLDELSGVKGWRTHDLRRTVATGLQRLGVTLQAIEAVLGHVSGSRSGVVGIYQRHSFDAEKRAALDAWGEYIKSL